MRKFVARLVVFALGLLGVLALPLPAAACVCPPAGSPADAFGQATVVFRGRVTSVTNGYATFRVDQSWKGPASRQAVVNIGAGGLQCVHSFAQGREYIVYATESAQELVSPCTTRLRPVGLGSASELGSVADLLYLSTRSMRGWSLAMLLALGMALSGLGLCLRRRRQTA